MARLVAQGKYLFDGAEKFYARGVSYGPFPPNSRGERYPEPDRAGADFALMRELGANVIRVYVPPPPWLFELAAKHELRLMVGMPWPFHMAFLDSPQMMRDIRETIRTGVASMRGFADSIFAYSIGNEVRSDIARWHGPRATSRFLAELYDLGKQADPGGLFTYSNYPSTEYLNLDFLDFVSFNVYLHHETDFRRYLTHLLGLARERPLVLSETGMDTQREGQDQQAQLLSWQSRAAFELGLSGFIVFAFTDEWHTGGSAITDWDFGLVTRDRTRKRAFADLAQVFKGEIPPPLKHPPKASVVVAAYNAAASIGACLESLRHLNYPDYETIVVDDGSTDATASIAEQAAVRAIRLEHGGLAAARNAGIGAAAGGIVAFIDADARADRDWLYHLAETLARREAVAAGGPNFPPPPATAVASAIAAAPGEPREVRLGDDALAQLCGCNMAIDKAALARAAAAGGDGGALSAGALFDPDFVAAGDDVDLSWRLRDRGLTLAYAPGAIVTHDRRATIGAYLEQQSGYGRGEGVLYRKYPLRGRSEDEIYGGAGWLASLFGGGERVYYGALGRGLFQSVYPGSRVPPIALIPVTIQWLLGAIVLLLAGIFNPVVGLLGVIAIAATIASACLAAALAPVDKRAGPASRVILAVLCLLGPLARSLARWRTALAQPDTMGSGEDATPAIELTGQMVFSPNQDQPQRSARAGELVETLRAALVRRGLAVATSNGYESYDLQVMSPWVRVPLHVLADQYGSARLGWRLEPAPRAATLWSASILAFAMVLGATLAAAIVVLCLVWGAIVLCSIRKLSPAIRAAARDTATALKLTVENGDPNL